MGERINEWRPRTADRRRTGFPAGQGANRQRIGERINEWRLRTADRRRTGFPAGQGANRQRIGERINEWRPRTADRRRTGFPACRTTRRPYHAERPFPGAFQKRRTARICGEKRTERRRSGEDQRSGRQGTCGGMSGGRIQLSQP